LLTPHEQYIKIDRDEITRRKSYRALFKNHVDVEIDDKIREATNGNIVLGNDRFQDEIAKALGRRVVKGKTGQPKKKDDAHK